MQPTRTTTHDHRQTRVQAHRQIISMAPHMDAMVGGESHQLKMPRLDAYILAAAAHLGLPKPTAQRIVKEVTSRVEREFAAISRRHEEMAENPPPNRSPYTAVEARLLRVMQHIVLKDMLERLLPK